ncbi:nucleoside deaminase [Ornithinicoccus halotolerans]|uniref:nucleoside deaminase n=1 Tax=Ornithinicoccus halotolerans TaxID=1748220 RepID=UPI001E4BA3AA|nr:nucleoside deaminase [Ornithinicoccus halotolerans]
MREALALARAAAERSRQDVPVGALVVGPDGTVLGRGANVREAQADPTGHAEVVALRAAGARLGRWRLESCTLVATLEPCAMCAGAAVLARVGRIVFGAFDPKAGACGSVWDLPRDRQSLHRPEVVAGVAREDCEQLLLDFFRQRRLR